VEYKEETFVSWGGLQRLNSWKFGGTEHNCWVVSDILSAGSRPFCYLQTDSSAPITLRTRKFITNRLLARRQFVIDVLHPSRPNVSKSELSEKLAALYKTEKNRVVTFGFRTQFGGGRSTGFALIYDDEASQRKFEPRYRLVRVRLRFICLSSGSSPHLALL